MDRIERLALVLLAAVPALAARASAQKVLHTVNGDSATDAFGQVVDVIGDANGDGLADFIAGAWRDDPAGKGDAGTVRLHSGLDGTTIWSIPGDLPGDHMGWGSSGAGDVNGDGRADFVAAADEADLPGKVNAGSAKVVSGATGATLWFLQGVNAGDLFGWSSAPCGDVDNDGFDDVIVGAIVGEAAGGALSAGSARVFSGATGLPIWSVGGDSGGDQLGYSVAGVGDVNADGHADFLAGAPADDNVGNASGSARLYSGKTGLPLMTFNGDGAGDSFGRSVGGAGDVNLDGVPDLVVGAHLDDNGAGDTGSARLISGATLATLHTFNGDALSDQLGMWVHGAGDVDGDGYADVVAGIPGDDDNGGGAGSLRVFTGKTLSVLHTFHGDNGADALGTSVSGGFDADGDGFADLIAGAPGDDNAGSGSGSARVYSAIHVGISHYGAGTPGCAGTQRLNASAPPTVGNAGFGVVGDHAPPSSLLLGLVADVADVAGSDPFGFGVAFHVDLFASAQLLSFDAFTDAAGSAFAPLPLPADPSIAGATLHLQTLAVWGAPCGPGPLPLSSSIGMTVTFQP